MHYLRSRKYVTVDKLGGRPSYKEKKEEILGRTARISGFTQQGAQTLHMLGQMICVVCMICMIYSHYSS